MADVYKAYNFLNDSLKLNLSEEQMAGVEAAFKAQWVKDKGFDPSVKVNNWEFFSYLIPRNPEGNGSKD